MSNAILVIGLIAAALLIVAYGSQSIQTIKTKNTVGINPIMFGVVWLACLFFVIYGIMLISLGAQSDGIGFDNLGKALPEDEVKQAALISGIVAGVPILISNLVVGFFCSIVFYIKLKNMLLSKKHNVSEEQYYEKFILKKSV